MLFSLNLNGFPHRLHFLVFRCVVLTTHTLFDAPTPAVCGDPLAYVLWAFPWGEKGTLLADETGPDKWQVNVLSEVSRQLSDPAHEGAIQINVASGHGVGKTALIAWLILWAMSTRPHPQVITTANTKEQLLNKTWRELAKWSKLALNGHWFEWSATKFSKKSDKETWFATAVTWSKERSEAFAGTHEKHVIQIFDEGSAIADEIYDVAQGGNSRPVEPARSRLGRICCPDRH